MNVDRGKLKFLLVIVAVWTAFGIFFGTQSYIRETYAGRPASLSGFIISWIFCGYSWGLLTYPVLRFMQQFSLPRLGWYRFLLMHIPAAFVFSFVQLGIYLMIAGVLFRASGRGFWEFYKFLLANELQSSLLVYAAIVAAVTAYHRFFGIRSTMPLEATLNEPSAPAKNRNSVASASSNGFIRRIAVKENGRILLIGVDEIVRVESYGNYLFLHTDDRKYLHRETMTAIEKKLDPYEFVRIRRSAIVRIDRIKEMHPVDNGEFEIILDGGIALSSTRRYKTNLEPLLKY